MEGEQPIRDGFWHRARTPRRHWRFALTSLALVITGCSDDGRGSQASSQTGDDGAAASGSMPGGDESAQHGDDVPSVGEGDTAGSSGSANDTRDATTNPTADDGASSAADDAAQATDAGIALADAGSASVDGGAVTSSEWTLGRPEDYGLTTEVLDAAADRIQRATGNRYGMVVIRKGVLIYEKYWQGGPDDHHILYSCTKSWGSSLIGIAVTRGLMNVADDVRDWVPEPAPGVSEGATVEHLLTQSAHTRPPGQSFRYNSGYLLNTLPEALAAASGMPAHAFFEQYLAQPLGLDMVWPACPAGGCAGTRYEEGFIQFGNQPPEAPNADLPTSSVRDQAKLGWLWANDGMWNGRQLIDPQYIAQGSQPGSGFRRDYGYLWWIEGADQFSAIGGVGNCYVNVMPSRELVIAVMGDDAGLGQGGGWADFRGVVDALED